MSAYNDAALALERQAVKYEGLMAAAKTLREIGALDQAAKACQAEAAVAKKELDGLQADIKKAKADLKSQNEKIALAAEEAKIKVDGLLAGADYEAKARIDAATEVAEQIKAAAKAEADIYLASSRKKAEKLAAEKMTLEQQISANLDALAAQKAEAEDLEKRIAKAQASIAKLLG